MHIKDLFEIKKPKTLTFTSMIEDANGINFVSSRATHNGCNGKVKKQEGIIIYPAGAISVPLKGSVLQASLQTEDFYCAHQTAVLIPKINLTTREKIYYILVIRSHAEKYNYGRQADRTIEDLEIPSPDEIPSWVYEMEIPTFDDISEAKTTEKVELPPINEWKSFKYNEIFDIKKATGPKISEVKKTIGNIPYVSATAENNGVAHFGDFIPTMSGNCLTVGHLGDCFYQEQSFSGSNVTVLIPKFELNKSIAMFLTTLINANKFKYSYGRVIGITRLKEETLSLPVTKENQPNWELIKNYINSLSYSKYL